jgi:hypothetical protein
MSETVELILTALKEVPPTFWGVVIGGVISIAGIVITNRAHESRLAQQFSHDEKLKKQDREFTLRQNIYLSAAEAVSAGFQVLNSFANLDKSDDDILKPYLEKISSIAKLQIIAKEETLRAVMEFITEFNDALTSLMPDRIKLLALKNEILILDNLIQDFGKVRDEMVQRMRQYNIEGKANKQEWGAIKGNFDFEQKRIDEHLKRRSALWEDIYSRQLDLVETSYAKSAKLIDLIGPALLSLRSELDFPGDREAIELIVKSMLSRNQASISKLVADVRDIREEHLS